MENILDVVAENGVPFRVILTDQTIDGEGDNFLSGKEEHIVKVYDRRYDHTPNGQFTGASAYISTLLEKDSGSGWALYGGVSDWTIDPTTFRLVRDWLYHYTY